jgi:hypothetical protein
MIRGEIPETVKQANAAMEMAAIDVLAQARLHKTSERKRCQRRMALNLRNFFP